jgi:hypothetical protein
MGVNDAGLLACLLNAYPHPAPLATGVRSRGIIVPDLLPLGTLDDMAAAALALDASLFSPFRLLLANGSETLLISAGPSRPRIEHARTDEPAIMLTSSGLGDHIVESHRRALFEFIFASDRDPLHAQSVFHRNRSEHEPHLSVSMSRTGARTLSRTTVDFDHASFSMNHLPLAEDGSSVTQGLTRRLPLAPSNVPRATADVYA